MSLKTMKFTLPRQTTPYTCGHSSLAAVGRLLGGGKSEHEIVKSLSVIPRKGLDNTILAQFARDNYPVKDVGQDVYTGGLAIANIKNHTSHNGHFVIVLGERNGTLRYYCPLFGVVFERKREDILWENASGLLHNWAVTFDTQHDYYDAEIEAETHVFIIGDPMEQLQPQFDTSLLLMRKYNDMDQSVSWHITKDIFTRGRMLYLSGVPVLKNDIVWMRCDPVNTVEYYEMLRRLALVEATILNDPKAILNFHDKLTTTLIDDNLTTYTVSSREGVEYAIKHLNVQGYRRYVIKAPSLFGGRGVYFAATVDEAADAFDKVAKYSGYAIVQGFVSTGNRQVDRRVLVTPDLMLGAIDRVAPENSLLCNLHSGGSAEKAGKLSAREENIIRQVQDIMRDAGVFLAGLDFMNGHLIEVNITCPSAVPQMKKVDNPDVDMVLINAAYDYARKITPASSRKTLEVVSG